MKIVTTFILFITGLQIQAQNPVSAYNPHDLFAPQSYPQGINEYRNSAGEPGLHYWQNKADYQIDATLDETKNEIKATVTITYRNNSPQSLSYIWLILEQNLFHPQSRGFEKNQTEGRSRYVDSRGGFRGGYHFQSIKLLSQGADNKFVESAVDTVISDTRMQVRLSKPLVPKAEIKLKMEYSYTVPEYGADRTGIQNTANGKIFSIAQWYPRVCVFDDIRGWNADPYLGAGEFYLEYGDYNVSISAPSDHVVVSSGELLNPREVLTAEQLKRYNTAKESETTVVIRSKEDISNPATRVKKPMLNWKFQIKNSRDFAWAASKAFIWDAARINLPGGKKIPAMSVYPAESEGIKAWGRSTEYIKGAIENYSRRWYEYPFPSAVNVASNVSGMEYPGIIFCGYQDTGESLWSVTDHEFGHSWFPMIVGNNERRYGWMDEGFNTFINGISTEEFNKGEYRQPNINGQAVAMALTSEKKEKVLLTPDGMKENNIGINLYFKPAYALNLLRNNIIGHERYDYAFRKYIHDWAFKHPTPWDFFRSIENSTGEDLGWFWKGLILENYQLDQAIIDVEKTGTSGGVLITIRNLQKMAMPVVVELTTMSGKLIRKSLPVEIWQNSESYTFRMETTEPVRKVVIDPDKVFPDIQPQNNTWQGIK
jgi:hypothetical protein